MEWLKRYRTGILALTLLVCFVGNPFLSELLAMNKSQRSIRAVRRVTPKLEKACEHIGYKLGNHVFIRIFKQEHLLEIWLRNDSGYKRVAEYPIAYFSGKLGPKTVVGDVQAPEGFYYVKAGSFNPWSSYHLSFNIGYPNEYDRYHKRTGGLIMIHGNEVSIGCYAMTDPLIEEIYTYCEIALESGQKFIRVHIFPFKMTDENMKQHEKSPWYSFWKNLKDGYQFFEINGCEPNVNVSDGEYIFGSPELAEQSL